MEKMNKDEIIMISNKILEESDVLANYSTSYEEGLRIMDDDFTFTEMNMNICNQKDLYSLCTYGLNDNKANSIISIPKSFFKQLLSFDDNEYEEWIKKCLASEYQENIIVSLCDVSSNNIYPFKATLPTEFIRGMFVCTEDEINLNNKEECLEHLTYVSNKRYFENLNDEVKQAFINEMRHKLFPEEPKKYY